MIGFTAPLLRENARSRLVSLVCLSNLSLPQLAADIVAGKIKGRVAIDVKA